LSAIAVLFQQQIAKPLLETHPGTSGQFPGWMDVDSYSLPRVRKELQ